VRLNKFIAVCGATSRRGADALIAEGRVTVNGAAVETMGPDVDPDRDEVRLDGRLIMPEARKVYIMLNKPAGYICSCRDDRGRKTVLTLIDGVDARIFPVGRLDYDTEGLLLLTNDGDFAYRCTHPAHEVEKEYLVIAYGLLEETAAEALRAGVMLDGVITSPAMVKVEKRTPEETRLTITVHEGRNRQVRRMIEAVGSSVKYLKRVSEGSLKLGGLKPGKWRYLTDNEFNRLVRLLK
jgi:pseudouridine synthase